MRNATHQVFDTGVFRLSLLVLAFMIPTTAGYASSSPTEADSVHFCLPFDLEEMQARDSIYAAGKQALNLNVGSPRTVRMIYFLPNDRPFRASVVDSMKRTIRQIQTFYGEQMQAHGYGYKTFAVESDASGEPIVHRLDGQYPDSHYLDNTSTKVPDEFQQAFDRDANIYLIVVDNSNSAIGTSRGKAGGTGISRGKVGGHALVHGAFSFRTAAHELGHAFGLNHDFSDDSFIMSYGGGNRRALSMCSAGFLAVHAYFNTNIPIEGDSETGFSELIDGVTDRNFELISSREYPSGSNSVSIRLNVSDSDGLHVVLLLIRTREPHPAAGSFEVKACRTLGGLQNTAITFDYDGIFPSDGGSSLSNPVRHEIFVQTVDSEGNLRGAFFPLIEISAELIGTLRNTDKVPSVAFSPDGRTLAAGSNGGTVKLWDVATQTNVATLGTGRSVAFSPDGATIAVGGGGIKLWDVKTKKQIAKLSNPDDSGWSIAFSSDGTTIASGSDNTINLYDATKKKHIDTLGELTGWTFSVAFAPNGTTLASGGTGGGVINLWDVSTRRHIGTLSDTRVRISDISSVAFSPDGSTIASGSGSGYVYDLLNLWDLTTKKHVGILANRGGSRTVAFSPDGSVLASGGGQGAIKLWDVLTREPIGSLGGHVRDVQSLAFSPDGRILASGSDDTTIRLWDVSGWTSSRPRPQTLQIVSGNDQQSSPGSALANPVVVEVRDQNSNPLQGVQVTFTVTAGDGRLSGWSAAEIATTDINGRATVRLTLGANQGTTVVVASVAGLDAVTFSAVATGSVARPNDNRLRGHRRVVRSVAFSPDGQVIASGSADSTVILWDVAKRSRIATLGHSHLVRSVAFSPDGAIFAVGSNSRAADMFDIATQRKIGTFSGHRHLVTSLAFSPDGTTLATGSQDRTIKLWNVATRQNIATLSHTFVVESVAFSPDGGSLASGSWGGTSSADPGVVWLWDVSTRQSIAKLEGHAGAVRSVAFSPDGTILASGAEDYASGSYDGKVILWDVGTRKSITTLEGFDSWVYTVAFSPDGTILALGTHDSRDSLIKLWNMSIQEFVATFRHVQPVHSVAFSPDGTILASGGGRWDLESSVVLRDVSQYTSAVSPSAGSNADAVLSLDLIPDGGAGNQVNDGVTSGTVAGKDTKIAVEVFASGVKTPLAGLLVKFDFDSSVLAFVKAESGAFGFNIPQATGTYFAATNNVVLPASGFLTRGEFNTLVDVTNRPFSIGIDVVTLAESQTVSNDIRTTKVISFNAIPPPATFSLSLDGNTAAGDQGLTTLDVGSGSVVPIQLFGNDIRGVNGFSARFEYDATQVGYEEFDRGGILPNAQVLEVADTNPTAIDISVVSFGGQATVDSGLLGSVRFRTTDAFSGTTLRLVSAELGRGDQREKLTLSDTGVTLSLAQLTPDFNSDGKVDFGDFVAFGMRFGASRGDERYEAKYDLDEDGTIGFGDFLIFGREFGT